MKEKRKEKRLLCHTCGEVQTHKAGLLKSLSMPETVEGLVYKGICLKCNSLADAKMQLCEPIDGFNDSASMRNLASRRSSIFSTPRRPLTSQDCSSVQSSIITKHLAEEDSISLQASAKKKENPALYTSNKSSLNSLGSTENRMRNRNYNQSNLEVGGFGEEDHPSRNSNPMQRKVQMNKGEQLHSVETVFDQSHNKARESWSKGVLKVYAANSMKQREPINNLDNSATTKNNNSLSSGNKDCITSEKSEAVLRSHTRKCTDSTSESGDEEGSINKDCESIKKTKVMQRRGPIQIVAICEHNKVIDNNHNLVGRRSFSQKISDPAFQTQEPFLIPGYYVGEKGNKQDMMNATTEDFSNLCVGDCSFVRRTNKTWVYAIVAARSVVSIELTVNSKGSTKTFPARQWSSHIKLPSRPSALSEYSLYNAGQEGDPLVHSTLKEVPKYISRLSFGFGGGTKHHSSERLVTRQPLSFRPPRRSKTVVGLSAVKENQKQKGLFCHTCEEVQTHTAGLSKWRPMPETVEGIVYKGICLRCNSLDAAKMQLYEPIDGMDGSSRRSRGRSSILWGNRPSWPQDCSSVQSSIVTHHTRNSPTRGEEGPIMAPSQENYKENHSLCSRSPGEPFDSIENIAQDLHCNDSNLEVGNILGEEHSVEMSNDGQRREVINKEDRLHGNGEIANRGGHTTTKQLWSKAVFKVSAATVMLRRDSCLLPGYSAGEEGNKEDMTCATTEDFLMLSVGDCSFIRRSDQTWSYAIVADRSVAYISFTMNSRGSTKTVPLKQWSSHIKLPARPSIHPGYSVGNTGHAGDMLNHSSRKEATKAASRLRIGGGAFCMRSNGSWAYAIVKDRDESAITFQVNAHGSTKVIELSKCGKFVRCIKH